MTSYFIFKTDNISEKTTLVCCGTHKDEHECSIHFQSYKYGFCDGCVEALGPGNFKFMDGTRKNSFLFGIDGKNVEYFMLLDKEGIDLVSKIS